MIVTLNIAIQRACLTDKRLHFFYFLKLKT